MLTTKYKQIRIAMAVVCFFTHSGCIHVKSQETLPIEVKESQKRFKKQSETQNLRVQSVIYHNSVYPLERFFTHLKEGGFSEAFNKIDLSYREANFDNKGMQELLDAGFVPVYVRVQNLGQNQFELDEKSFNLNCGGELTKAYFANQLPRKFEEFSPKAVAANVYNIGLVMVGFVVVVGVLVLAAGGGGQNHVQFSPGSSAKPMVSLFDQGAINSTKKLKVIDYKGYLLTEQKLDPFSAVEGLLFFYSPSLRDVHACDLAVN